MSSPARLGLQIFDSPEKLELLRAGWEELLASFPYATTFSSMEWLLPWWQAFGDDDHLRVLAFSDSSSNLAALAPMVLTKRRVLMSSLRVLRLMGDGSGDSDNLDLPVLPGRAEEFAEAFLGGLENLKDCWDICELNTLPATSIAALAILRIATKKNWNIFEYSRVASAISLPGSWDEYLKQLANEDRKNLERYTRRLGKRYQVRIYRCSDEGELNRCLEALFELHQSRWSRVDQSGSFGSSQRRDFYGRLSRSLLARDWLQFWVLELDGKIAAAQFAFRYRDTVFQLQEGNDPNHSSDRVGVVLRGHVLQRLVAEGVRTYDFLGGEPGYKARWGARPHSYLDIKLARRFSRGGAYLRTIHQGAKSKVWLREKLSPSAWKLLHQMNGQFRGNNAGDGAPGEP